MKFSTVIRPTLVVLSAFLFFRLHVSDSLIGLALHVLASFAVYWVMGLLVGVDAGWFSALLFSAHPLPADVMAAVNGRMDMAAALVTLLTIGFYDRATRARLMLLPLLLAVVGAIWCGWLNESVIMLPLLLTLTRVFRIFWELRADQRPAAFRKGLPYDLAFWAMALFAFLLRTSGSIPGPSLPSPALLALIGLAALVASLTALIIGKHAAIFSVCFCGITLLPILPGMRINSLQASSTLYLPVLGICLLAAFLINQLRDVRVANASALALTFLLFLSGTTNASPWQWRAPVVRARIETSPVAYPAPAVLFTDATAELQSAAPVH